MKVHPHRLSIPLLLLVILGLVMPTGWRRVAGAVVELPLSEQYRDLMDLHLSETAGSIRHQVFRQPGAEFELVEGEIFQILSRQRQPIGALYRGRGRFVLRPPQGGERAALARATGRRADAEEWSEYFQELLLLGSDPSIRQLCLQASAEVAPDLEIANAELARLITRVRKTWRRDLAIRLMANQFNPSSEPFLWCLIAGQRLPGLVFGMDPQGLAPSLLGSEEAGLLDVGASDPRILTLFNHGPIRTSVPAVDKEEYDILHYGLKTELRSDTTIHCLADISIRSKRDGLRFVRLALDPRLRILGMRMASDPNVGRVDAGTADRPLEFVQGGIDDDPLFGLLLPEPIQKNQVFGFTCEYEGRGVVSDSGDRTFVLNPDALGLWYPSNWQVDFGDRALFEIELRVPRDWRAVFTGELVSRELTPAHEVSRWTSRAPIPAAALAVGEFATFQGGPTGLRLECYAGLREPGELHQRRRQADRLPRGRDPSISLAEQAEAPSSPSSISSVLAGQMLSMAGRAAGTYSNFFGSPLFPRLAIVQLPSKVWPQSRPMLVYLPFTAALDEKQWRTLSLSPSFDEAVAALGPHEIAHQWWAGSVGWKTYHDEWLSEGLAEFSVSLYLQYADRNDEAANHRRFLEFWRVRRERLTAGLGGARRRDIAQYFTGPISLGMRLNHITPGAFRSLLYPKGAFLAHMLRMMMLDPDAPRAEREARFITTMKTFVDEYGGKNPSTADFQHVTERFMRREMDLESNGRLDWFFDEWWAGSDLPHYDLAYRISDAGGTGKVWFRISQQQVSPRFRMLVPLYADYGKGRIQRIGLARLSGIDSSEGDIQLAERPVRLLLCANEDILCTKSERRLD